MSKIDELIAELCPEGVEFKALGEVGEFTRGNGLQKKDFTETGVGCIHYGQIYTHYGTSATETKSYVAPAQADRLRKATTGDLVVATTSENEDDVCKAVAWLGSENVAVSGDSFVFSHSLDPLYAAYFFQSDGFQSQKRRTIIGTKVKRVSGSALAKIRVPVPPLEIQVEIAQTLAMMEQLEAELEAELEARRKQYEYYRDSLLTFDESERVDWVTLGDVGQWFGGGTPKKSISAFWTGGTIPWLSPKDMVSDTVTETGLSITNEALSNSPLRLVPSGSVAFVVRSNILRRRMPIAHVPTPVTLNQDLRAVVPREDIFARYLFQVCRANAERILVSAGRTDGSMAAIESKALLDFEIPVPPLDQQHRIVAALDNFDTLTNDLTTGLPAEIAARRKQYEYYRDKLLTFDELAA